MDQSMEEIIAKSVRPACYAYASFIQAEDMQCIADAIACELWRVATRFEPRLPPGSRASGCGTFDLKAAYKRGRKVMRVEGATFVCKFSTPMKEWIQDLKDEDIHDTGEIIAWALRGVHDTRLDVQCFVDNPKERGFCAAALVGSTGFNGEIVTIDFRVQVDAQYNSETQMLTFVVSDHQP